MYRADLRNEYDEPQLVALPPDVRWSRVWVPNIRYGLEDL